MSGGPEHLLSLARAAVRTMADDDDDPTTATHRILAAWSEHDLVTHDEDFTLDDRTGVEALAFVATDGGGVVLRLPGELPDSFEPVPLDGAGPHQSSDVRQAFFRGLRPGR